MHDHLVLGIDGGGTKTLAAITDREGTFLGCGWGGSSNLDDVGFETTQKNIGEAVAAACFNAGTEQDRFSAVFLGMAGVVSDKDRNTINQIALNLRLAQPSFIGIDHDCRIALAGGLSGRPGIVLITGTGSSCYGRDESGQDWRSGGWGHLISDEGSSYWLGLQAMRIAVMTYDGRIPLTAMMGHVMRYLGLSDMNDIMHRIYVEGLSRAEVAGMAPLVVDAARLNDAIALSLIHRGAQELADCVLTVANQLAFSGSKGTDPFEIALIGGLLKAGDVFETPLRQAILERMPLGVVIRAELPPVAGACLLALQGNGQKIKPQTLKNMI